MIELIHKYPILIKVLLGITTFAFVATGGILYMGSGGTDDWAARVDGNDIPVSEYQQLLSRYEDFYRDLFQGEIPPEQRARLNLEEMTLNELIDRRVILLTLEDMGIRIGDKQVSETIVSNPSFADESGRFNKAIYLDLLSQYGMSPKTYEESVRRDIAVTMFRDMVKESATVSDAEAYSFFIEQMRVMGEVPDKAKFEEQKDGLKKTLMSNKENILMKSMMDSLRENYDIETRELYGGKKAVPAPAAPATQEAGETQ